MEYYLWINFPLLVIIALFVSLDLLFLLSRRISGQGQLPPGPPGWPILGNILNLGSMPHRTLAKLRHKYGEVIWLRLGTKNTMVILSAKSATELFKIHDLSFAERSLTEATLVHDFHKSCMALSPYGSYWRVLRRLMTTNMLVTKRLNETAFIREKCVDKLLLWIEKEISNKPNKGVQVARFVFLMGFNLLGNLMLSKDLLDPNSKEGSEFFEAMKRITEWAGQGNMADFFPWLRWLDPQGLRRKMKRDLGKAIEIGSKFVKERMNESQLLGNREMPKDFLDLLLEFEGNGKDEPAKLCEHNINCFILEMFMGGSETTSSTIEWALTELLCNPESMTKVKAELTQKIGKNKKVEESDLENLPYLQAIMKETLRLHPPISFLIPRRATQNTNFMGYFIPKDTQVLVNAWAIGRDPDVWNDPLSFKPERFMGSKVDYRGQHYELIPFGAGRRMCAGLALGHRIIHLVLGALLHQFDWELDGSVNRETLDMNDSLGMTTSKSVPLLAVPKKCIYR